LKPVAYPAQAILLTLFTAKRLWPSIFNPR
jgi:hypothetical protein